MKKKQNNETEKDQEIIYRHYKNPYDEYDSTQDVVLRYGKIYPELHVKYKSAVSEWLKTIMHSVSNVAENYYTIYKGSCGVALLLFLLVTKKRGAIYLDTAIDIVEKSLPHLKNIHMGFLRGDAGPLALAAVLYHYKGLNLKAADMVTRLCDMSSCGLQKFRPTIPEELSFGRAGYLHALLFVRKHMDKDSLSDDLLRQVVEAVLEAGVHEAERRQHHVPLAWEWQGRCYLGAAHGQAGVLAQLLQAAKWLPEGALEKLITPSLEYLEALRMASGNFPVALGRQSDRLVQWCHGAPGLALTFTLAYKVLKSDKWLRAAETCAEVTWRRGLLTKGYGLCHGAAGNGYVFIALYQATKNPLHLHRACRFAEWCTTYGLYQTREPDRPFSLFEGVVGPTYFLIDILSDPMQAAFPGFIL